MSKYRAVCGNLADEKSYSSNSDVVLALPYIRNRTITVYAIDSRGNSTSVSNAISVSNWKDYVDPEIRSASVARQGGVGTTTTLTFEGTFWKPTNGLDFGAVSNEIETCQYKYKKSNENNYGNAIDITPTIQNGNFSFNANIAGDEGANGFNLSNSFNIQITIKDKIRTITYDLLLGAGTPAMAMHRNGVAFGAPYNTQEGGSLQEEGHRLAYSDCVQMYSTFQQYVPISAAWTGFKINLDEANVLGTALSFDSTNNRIVANEAGYVDFIGQLTVYLSGYVNGDYALDLFKNGSFYRNLAYERLIDTKYYDSIHGTMYDVPVNEGDYFELAVSCSSTGTVRTFQNERTSLIANFRRSL